MNLLPSSLLAPGIALMRRCRLRTKLGAIALLALVTPLWLVVSMPAQANTGALILLVLSGALLVYLLAAFHRASVDALAALSECTNRLAGGVPAGRVGAAEAVHQVLRQRQRQVLAGHLHVEQDHLDAVEEVEVDMHHRHP